MSSDVLYPTEAAVAKIWALMQEEENFQLKLRVYVIGGGCSGFQYGFAFEEAVKAHDHLVTRSVPATCQDTQNVAEQQVTLIVDPISLQYLEGSEIDYREDIEGEQFIIRNPNAKTTCGCGSSFSA